MSPTQLPTHLIDQYLLYPKSSYYRSDYLRLIEDKVRLLDAAYYICKTHDQRIFYWDYTSDAQYIGFSDKLGQPTLYIAYSPANRYSITSPYMDRAGAALLPRNEAALNKYIRNTDRGNSSNRQLVKRLSFDSGHTMVEDLKSPADLLRNVKAQKVAATLSTSQRAHLGYTKSVLDSTVQIMLETAKLDRFSEKYNAMFVPEAIIRHPNVMLALVSLIDTPAAQNENFGKLDNNERTAIEAYRKRLVDAPKLVRKHLKVLADLTSKSLLSISISTIGVRVAKCSLASKDIDPIVNEMLSMSDYDLLNNLHKLSDVNAMQSLTTVAIYQYAQSVKLYECFETMPEDLLNDVKSVLVPFNIYARGLDHLKDSYELLDRHPDEAIKYSFRYATDKTGLVPAYDHHFNEVNAYSYGPSANGDLRFSRDFVIATA